MCSVAEAVRICRHVAQMHERESLALNFLDHYREDVALCLLVLGKEDKSSTIFSLLGHGNALEKNKLMGYLKHDTRAVAGSAISTFCTTMAHVFKYF